MDSVAAPEFGLGFSRAACLWRAAQVPAFNADETARAAPRESCLNGSDQETCARGLPDATKSPRSNRISVFKAVAGGLKGWPWSARFFVLAVLALYFPVLQITAVRWLSAEQYTHSLFVFPVSGLLLWMKRRELALASRHPSAWGLLPLFFGLLLQTVSHYLNIEFLGMLSLIPVLAGGVLLLHGDSLWRAVRFPVCFLGFAANLPGFILSGPSQCIQSISATGASILMKTIGFTLVQHGNLIDVPGMTLEVADVCSGFRKLTALLVFTVLFGYLYPIGFTRRLLLVLTALPIAIFANIARLCVLIAAASLGGEKAESFLHNPAEFAVLVLSFVLILRVGKRLGCTAPRFSLFSLSS
jgi:exosortase